MPFQPIDFANIQPQGSPWMRDFVENLTTGYKAGRLPYETKQAEQKQDLENAFNKMRNQEQSQKFNSDMLNDQFTRALQGAQTSKINTLLPSDLLEANLKNKWYDKYTQSQIDANEAMANWRNTGGGTGGVDQKNQLYFQDLISKDNPHLSPSQIFEASNVLSDGGDTLKDGTKLNPMSAASRRFLGFMNKKTTTPTLVNQNVNAEQAEAEIPVVTDIVKNAQEPYSNRILGVSGQHFMDSLSTKPEAQKRLARYDASKELSVDLAALQNRVNSGQPTASITREILRRGQNYVDARKGVSTKEYNEEFMNFLNKSMQKIFEARKTVPISATTATTTRNNSNNNDPLGIR